MDSIFETLKNMGAGRLAMMLLTFFGLIIFFIFIAVRSSAPSLTLLYGDLSTADSTEIAAKLDNSSIPYKISDDGKQVSVPQKDVGKARMLLAQEGLPRKGSMGYEIFDQKQSFGTTSFQQNINQLRALEGELARTIGTIDGVRQARVHLVLPQRELFSRETQPASASVFLNLRNAASMGREQIQAIQHLVAAAVPQLKSARIAIIDQSGNLLARGEEDEDVASARNSDELRQKYEMRMQRSIEDMVGRIVGFGKVRATVTADLDFDVVNKSSESYNPDEQVVRSTQTVTDQSSDTTGSSSGADVSVQNNLPGLPGGASSGSRGSVNNNRNEETTNYEISKTVENVVRESGNIKKISVAVLVDGGYIPDPNVLRPEGAGDDWMAPKKYVPRPKEELDQISNLVKSAVGFDEDRGDKVEVVNMQFVESEFSTTPIPEDKVMGFLDPRLLGVAETLALSVVAVLIILLVLRPLATHFVNSAARSGGGDGGMTAQEEAALLTSQTPQAQLAPPGGMMGGSGPSELESMVDMGAVEGKVKASSVQKISELVTNHPNETISVIRQWMSTES